jgi:hypothetical protein
MEPGNSKTVFVVQTDYHKDMSDARRYGELRAVFGHPRKPYDTAAMIEKARRVLDSYQPGDHLLMIGDPTLCAICMGVLLETQPTVNVLSWDKNSFKYIPQQWDFTEHDYTDFSTAED